MLSKAKERFRVCSSPAKPFPTVSLTVCGVMHELAPQCSCPAAPSQPTPRPTASPITTASPLHTSPNSDRFSGLQLALALSPRHLNRSSDRPCDPRSTHLLPWWLACRPLAAPARLDSLCLCASAAQCRETTLTRRPARRQGAGRRIAPCASRRSHHRRQRQLARRRRRLRLARAWCQRRPGQCMAAAARQRRPRRVAKRLKWSSCRPSKVRHGS